jgi:hypothetical protein
LAGHTIKFVTNNPGIVWESRVAMSVTFKQSREWFGHAGRRAIKGSAESFEQ